MKKYLSLMFLLLLISLLSSCQVNNPNYPHGGGEGNFPNGSDNIFENNNTEPETETNTDINENPDEVEVETNYKITYMYGTKNAYSVNENTITFNSVSAQTGYSISGSFDGNIVINTGDSYKFELELNGFTISSNSINPITILSGDEVQLTAKKDTVNYVYDYRDVVTDETLYQSSIYSMVDLELAGKGRLEVYSKNNNGIHTKDDLDVKNLSLNVVCQDNALKGNDSVTIESGEIKLVSKVGDGIKTTNSHISSKENQKGSITISGGTIDIYAACDGVDAAYDVVVSDGILNIYTDKYSGYSDEVTAVTNNYYYIKNSSNSYNYSIKYINSQTSETLWKNATYDSSKNRTYYYKIDKPEGYDKLELYIYSSNQTQGQENSYYKKYSMNINNSYDTLSISSRSVCSWTNYNTTNNQGGWPGGGMQDGNSDKGDHSTKGIKAENQIVISGGNIKINSYDDSIHASNIATLENGTAPLGNVNISGGNLTLYSNDDGLHADYNMNISGGVISITNAYEGVEGYNITVSGGSVGVVSKDDGFNATNMTGSAITLTGGSVYIYAGGDGIDSNSRTSYGAITFGGSNVVVISTSNGNSAIDSDGGYTYTKGNVVAIMPSGGMSNESTHCSNFSSIGKKTTLSLTANNYLTITVNSSVINVTKLPVSINSGLVIYLGSSSANVTTAQSTTYQLDGCGVYWNK